MIGAAGAQRVSGFVAKQLRLHHSLWQDGWQDWRGFPEAARAAVKIPFLSS